MLVITLCLSLFKSCNISKACSFECGLPYILSPLSTIVSEPITTLSPLVSSNTVFALINANLFDCSSIVSPSSKVSSHLLGFISNFKPIISKSSLLLGDSDANITLILPHSFRLELLYHKKAFHEIKKLIFIKNVPAKKYCSLK